MFVKRLFHKSRSAAFVGEKLFDPRAISWAGRTFAINLVLLCVTRYRSAQRNLHRVKHQPRYGSDKISYRATSIQGDPHRSGILASARNLPTRPLVRRHAGRSCGVPPDSPRSSGRREAPSIASRGGQATRVPWISTPGLAALRLWREKRLKSEIHELQVLRGNHVEGQVHRG